MRDYSQLDARILEEIEKFDGIPTPHSLSSEYGGPAPACHPLLAERFKENSKLPKAAIKKGKKYITTCSLTKFEKLVSGKINTSRLYTELQKPFFHRLDGVIADGIDKFNGKILTIRHLGREGKGPIPFCAPIISNRLDANLELKQKFLEKQKELECKANSANLTAASAANSNISYNSTVVAPSSSMKRKGRKLEFIPPKEFHKMVLNSLK